MDGERLRKIIADLQWEITALKARVAVLETEKSLLTVPPRPIPDARPGSDEAQSPTTTYREAFRAGSLSYDW